MADLIAFLIEHFQDFDACPPPNDLGALLEEVGFDGEEINHALMLLEMLTAEPQMTGEQRYADSFRVYTADESDVLPTEVIDLLHFLSREKALNPSQRELVVYALLCMPPEDISVDLAKVLSLLVLWIQRSELPVLIGDELMMALHGEAVMH